MARNRAAQDTTLINLRHLKRALAALEKRIVRLEAIVTKGRRTR